MRNGNLRIILLAIAINSFQIKSQNDTLNQEVQDQLLHPTNGPTNRSTIGPTKTNSNVVSNPTDTVTISPKLIETKPAKKIQLDDITSLEAKSIYYKEVVCQGNGNGNRFIDEDTYGQILNEFKNSKNQLYKFDGQDSDSNPNSSEEPKPCTIILGDLTISGMNQNHDISYLNNIRAIFGSLRISHNNFKEISFTNLQIIYGTEQAKEDYYDSKGESYRGRYLVLEVVQNVELERINFPNLKVIKGLF